MLQFNDPFRIITTLGSRIILSKYYTEWLKNCPELDHQALIYDLLESAFAEMIRKLTHDTKRNTLQHILE